MSLIGRQYEVTDFNLVHSLLAIRGRQPSVRWEARARSRSRSGWDWKYGLEFKDLMPLQFFLRLILMKIGFFTCDFFFKLNNSSIPVDGGMIGGGATANWLGIAKLLAWANCAAANWFAAALSMGIRVS